jgi:hypothetical protein
VEVAKIRRVLWVLPVAIVLAAVPAPASASRVALEKVPGTILDAQPDRILFIDRSSVLGIEDRQTDAITQIPSVAGKVPHRGFITPHGAIFAVTNQSSNLDELYEWRDGSLVQLLGSLDSDLSLIVKGKWAIYSGAPACCSYSLFLRDLDLGVTTTVSTDAGNWANDVAENGDVAYWTGATPAAADREIFRYRNGSSQQLTNDTTLWNTWVLTDGINVAYSKHSQCCFNDSGSVAVYTANGEVVLDSFRNSWPEPYRDFQVAGGWVAYTHIGAGGETQVWERSPTGTVTQLSPSGKSATIVAMDGQGGVMFQLLPSISQAGNLYLGRPGQSSVNFGTGAIGLPGVGNYTFWHDGSWYEAGGGTLYKFVSDPGYPRPKGASPIRVPLTIAYKPCSSPNREHGPPLVAGSCNPPAMGSSYLTVGTLDANGKPARSEGAVRLDSVVDKPATADDESDVKLRLDMSDVFTKALDDYAGELRTELAVQGTDKLNAFQRHTGTVDHIDSSMASVEITTTTDHGLQDGADVSAGNDHCVGTITVTGPRSFFIPSSDKQLCGFYVRPGTPWYELGFRDPGPGTFDFSVAFSAACVPTTDVTIGSDCSRTTSANALVPGTTRAGYRTIWQLGQIKVYDGGSDGSAGTTSDNTLFADEGIFVP